MTEARLILPVTDDMINTLVRWGRMRDPDERMQKLEDWSANAPIEQIIATLMVQQIPMLVRKAKPVVLSIESVMAQLIEACTQDETYADRLRAETVGQLDFEALESGARALNFHGIDVLRHREVAGPAPLEHPVRGLFRNNKPADTSLDYITEDGRWDREFTQRLQAQRNPFREAVTSPTGDTLHLTDDQSRYFRRFLAGMDEPSHLTGLFGGGKTYLAGQMLEALQSYQAFRPVVLAATWAQLDGLVKRLGVRHVPAMTFGQAAKLAYESSRIPKHWRPGARGNAQGHIVPSKVAEALQIQPVGKLAPEMVADVALKTIRRFAMTRATRITARHLPFMAEMRTASDRETVAAYAQRIWDQTMEPDQPDARLPVRNYHIVKYAALRGLSIPDHYTHILIDEGHDLSAPMTEILDKSPQAVITMVDPHQRVSGFVPQRKGTFHASEISFTVRASEQVEGIFNTLIDKHPARSGVSLTGSRLTRTKVTYYDPSRPRVPAQSTAILVADHFEMLEWLVKLRESQSGYTLLPGSEADFYRFIASLDSLGS